MADNQPLPRLTEEDMRRRFNDGNYWARMKQGEFTEVLVAVHPDGNPDVLARHPECRSVTCHYRDGNDNTIVEVHYYQMPDGEPIPGKRPDPKLLFEDGVLYHKEKHAARLKRLAAEELARNTP